VQRRNTLPAKATSAEELALEAMELFGRAFARAGLDPAWLAGTFAGACERIPAKTVEARARASADIADAARHSRDLVF
jgi:hypothetical protein